jgi:hypothetical protein
MDGIVNSLRLGWKAMLFKEDAYEEMRTTDNPVVKGLILILIVGVVIALFAFVGDVLEWATIPDLGEIKDTVYFYLTQMPWWKLAAEEPMFVEEFERWYDFGWSIGMMASPSVGSAFANIITTPIGLLIRWLVYGLLAYLFARWLGGEASFTETLGVLALAVAPQVLNLITIIPYVTLGNLVAVWGILCAYVGLKTAHKLSWGKALGATLLPFILVLGVLVLASCLATAIIAALAGGVS